MSDILSKVARLLDIVAKLRNPDGGCPWDLEQTHQSLKPYVIEEAFEVVDAIDQDESALRGELGDLLLQVALHSQIASEAKHFDFGDVAAAVADKMVQRHPHVFGEVKVKDSAEVLQNWEQRKQRELQGDKSILDGVPRAMPALLRAQRVGEKAARVGFEWPTLAGVKEKVFEEIGEFLEQVNLPDADPERVAEEFGDVLFALSQLARRLSLNSEDLLNRATNKFIDRFRKMEHLADHPLSELDINALDALWEMVKRDER